MVESKFSRNVHLAPYPIAAGQRGARTLPLSGTAAGSFLFFLVFHFLNTFNLFKNHKLINVSIITREYPNQRRRNSHKGIVYT
jgi:hypothetical protein